MNNPLIITTILAVSLASNPAIANTESEQIRQDCENEVQSYGITDADEYQQVINDCIESLTPLAPEAPYENDGLPTENN